MSSSLPETLECKKEGSTSPTFASKPQGTNTPCDVRRLLKPLPTDSSLKVARLANHNSEAIRSHFVELTTAVLMPFASYCQAANPPDEGFGVADLQPAHLPAFSHAAFMDQLQNSPLPTLLQQRFRSQASTCNPQLPPDRGTLGLL